jgi:ABC-2 type transport system ATP-binding protein
MTEFVDSSTRHWVLVRSPALAELSARLTRAGAQVRPAAGDGIEVAGLDSAAIGDLAAAGHLTLHELATQHASLEDAFMDLTHDSVEFRAGRAAA